MNSACGSETHSHTRPSSGPDANGVVNTLWWSANNIMWGNGAAPSGGAFDVHSSCSAGGSLADTVLADPDLMLVPVTVDENVAMVDPRPRAGGIAFSNVDDPPRDGFFEPVNYKGAFGTNLWIGDWTLLAEMQQIPANKWGDEACGDITADTTWSDNVLLSCQTFVKDGATLTISAGTNVLAYRIDSTLDGNAPALVIERGAKIMAVGTSASPITFTSAVSPFTLTNCGSSQQACRGLWGGLIILGKAPTSAGADPLIEGLGNHPYGGNDANDNSGTLKYVRCWHGGSVIGANNEINGITFGGVGDGTTVEYVEVAYNLDDGFEWFGGTVNAKYISALFVGDDSLDTDLGYQGKMQYVFVMVGEFGNHATEMNSHDDTPDQQPRSYPQIYNGLFVGTLHGTIGSVSTDDKNAAMLRLREGTGGEFGNIIIMNAGSNGVRQNNCDSVTMTQTLPTSSGLPTPSTLFFSSKNIIHGTQDATTAPFRKDSADCSASGELTTASNDDPKLMLMPSTVDESVTFIDPRPHPTSLALTGDAEAYPSDSFYTTETFRGAFKEDLWIADWSILAGHKQIPTNVWGDVACSDTNPITADTTWASTVLLKCQTFVPDGKTLTINAGATVYAYADDGTGKAPALVIEKGAKIMAVGTKTSPITFTSAMSSFNFPARGLWGGLIILGKAPTNHASDPDIEGIPGKTYGGNAADDDSGTLKYVRVWYGGRVIGENNEINGITFGGVGSGTTVEYCEVAYNLDDGFEWFGGTVNSKYISALFVGDDALDTDKGYQGKIQFAFAMTGKGGHHAAEMDSKSASVDTQPRSFPQLYNALFVGSIAGTPQSVSSDNLEPAMMRLREGTGGEFGNIILTNVGTHGVYMNDCGSETRTQTKPASGSPDYLWWSPNNVVDGVGDAFYIGTTCSAGMSSPVADTSSPRLSLMPLNADEDTDSLDPRPLIA